MGHEQKYVDKKYEVVGTRFNRPDGIDKVTGKEPMPVRLDSWLAVYCARHMRMRKLSKSTPQKQRSCPA